MGAVAISLATEKFDVFVSWDGAHSDHHRFLSEIIPFGDGYGWDIGILVFLGAQYVESARTVRSPKLLGAMRVPAIFILGEANDKLTGREFVGVNTAEILRLSSLTEQIISLPRMGQSRNFFR